MAGATALERARLTIKGVRAQLVLEDGRITLAKDGPPATSRSFTVDQVRGAVLEPGSRGGRGWIHIAVLGGTLAPPGELAAMSDPYTLPVTSRSAVTARRLGRIVEKHLHERGLPSEPTFAASALEHGRFSTGVALTHAPGAARDAVGLRTEARDVATSVSPARNGSRSVTAPASSGGPRAALDGRGPNASSPASGVASGARPVPGSGSGSGATTSGSRVDDDADRRDIATAAAEAAIDERAADSDDRAPGAEIDEPAAETEITGSEPSAGAPAHGGASSVPTLPPPSQPPPPATGHGRDLATELRQLGELHASGVLTDVEFERAKARVLG
jgi:hypothetical protein